MIPFVLPSSSQRSSWSSFIIRTHFLQFTPMKSGMALLSFQPSQPSPGNSIQVANVVKDLGVLIDLSFSPSVNCKEADSKARWMLFMIRRSFAELSASAYAPLYNTLVRLHLEYAMQACSARKSSFSTRVKPCCRRRLFGVNPAVCEEARLPYEERLRRLGLHSLRRGRLLIVVYKLLTGGLDLDPSLFFIPPLRPGLRGHPFKVLQDPSRRPQKKSSFST